MSINIDYANTAGYHVENAKKLGVPAAILLDKIIRLSKCTNRKDGFCWYTAKQFEDETTFAKNTFSRAAKKLEEEGIVERKITYIAGTMTTATHFRLVYGKHFKASSEVTTMVTQIHHQSASRHYKENTKNYTQTRSTSSHEFGSEPSDLTSFGLDDSAHVRVGEPETSSSASPTAQPQTFINEEKAQEDGSSIPLENVPFGEVTKLESERANRLSLKPERNDAQKKHRAAAALTSELMRMLGVNGVVTGKNLKLVKGALANFTPDEIRELIQWSMGDEFYKDKTLAARLSADALEKWQMSRPRKLGESYIDENGMLVKVDKDMYN